MMDLTQIANLGEFIGGVTVLDLFGGAEPRLAA